MKGHSPIGAVVVTYLPDPAVIERLRAIRREVGRMIIVDNGSPPAEQTRLAEWAGLNDASILKNNENCGLAIALNQGMEWCEQAGCEWVVTLDQDSMPLPGMVAALLATARTAESPDRVAIVGARTYDEKTGRESRWLRSAWYGFGLEYSRGEDITGVTYVITSGALTRVSVWRKLDGFDDGLFIDYIDHDFCLRARFCGWLVGVSGHAMLLHSIGSRVKTHTVLGNVFPMCHSASRHYYMMRNRVLMWKRHGWRYPHWWLFDTCFGVMNLVRVMLAEDRRGQKLRAVCSGLWDGLLGRTGACPPEKLARFTR